MSFFLGGGFGANTMTSLSLILTPACMNIVQESHEPATHCTCRAHGIASEKGGAGKCA